MRPSTSANSNRRTDIQRASSDSSSTRESNRGSRPATTCGAGSTYAPGMTSTKIGPKSRVNAGRRSSYVAKSLDATLENRINSLTDTVNTISVNDGRSIARENLELIRRFSLRPDQETAVGVSLGPPPSLDRQLPEICFFDVKSDSLLPQPSKVEGASSKLQPDTLQDAAEAKASLPTFDKQHPKTPSKKSRPCALPASERNPKEALLHPPRREYMRIYYSDFLSQKPAEKPVFAGHQVFNSFACSRLMQYFGTCCRVTSQ